MKKILKPLASLYLTVALLILSIVLVFTGTWAQRVTGIDEVVRDYFRSWLTWIDPHIFMRGVHAGDSTNGGIPYPGGKTLVILLLANLLAAHSVRFKLNWKRSGILLIHFSLILLLAGELLTTYWAVESQITFRAGETMQYAQDIRHAELAVIDSSAADHDQVTVVASRKLQNGAVINSPQLPFEVRVDDYYPNSDLLGPAQADSSKTPRRATAGENANLALVNVPKNNGTDSSSHVDMPSAYVTLRAGDKNLGTYLLSTGLTDQQHVDINGKLYGIALRFERHYKPYSLTLLHFSHDRYLGTDQAKNFSSRVRLVDPSRNVDREVLIWMNHPLRYRGDTIYQQGFMPGDQYTTLQLAWNAADPGGRLANLIGAIGIPAPADPLPYIACFLGALGLLIHFGMQLVGFLGRRSKSVSAASSSPANRKGESWTLEPAPPLVMRPQFWVSAVVAMCAIFYIGGMAIRPAFERPDAYNFTAFGRLPVVSDGRVLPLDSLARNTLRIISTHDTLTRDKKEVSAVQWLLDGFADVEAWRQDQVVRIDHPDIISLLQLDPARKYFSIDEIAPHLQELQHQADLAHNTAEDRRDRFQSKMLQLADSIMLLNKVFVGFRTGQMYIVPPAKADGQWQGMTEIVNQVKKTGVKAPEPAMLFMQTIEDYANRQPGSFNSDVQRYTQYLTANHSDIARKGAFESYLNEFDPFMVCIVLYAIVLTIGFVSWIAWHRPLGTAALTLLVITLIVHTFALTSRIWLQGRPPVTNLYSSAVFIGWGAALVCVFLERIFKNGIATVTAAAIGFVTLVIALHLSGDAHLQPNGDTMAVLQAVLDTNLWLATHVVCVTLGYAATFLAGFLAIVYVVRAVLTSSLDVNARKDLARMIYGIVCFALLFSFVGTILGGIWADQSWGRFWGWDPKENGAILIVLWNAVILHSRWAGLVRERGFALLAVFGNIVTSWSWFGTNMLGIGLHSYGFMDAAVPWLLGFDLSQIALIGVALMPWERWRTPKPLPSRRPREAVHT
ncbi:MAG TPA: cytochrome c biogenesis protein CcsA [Tepidisphaeraceae bacterium]|jgi:ABC-type transport system involved in cytochrome c biogenesis permease subunit